MTLSSPLYLLFLAGVAAVFYLLPPGRPRRLLLLAASWGFYYQLSGGCAFVLVGVSAFVYAGGLALARLRGRPRSGLFFGVLLAVVLAPLLTYKYLPALLAVGGGAAPFLRPAAASLASWAFPVGISFFTFTALGYLIDVHLEVAEPERSPEKVALFLAFFPIVSAGPIERSTGLIPRLECAAPFTAERAVAALRLLCVGLVFKVVLSEILGNEVNPVFADPAGHLPIERAAAIVAYMFYLYAAFQGYTLLALGSAALFGVEARPNFRQPFLSPTVPEFWRCWHMSLSSWVRDYVFAPLRVQWRRHPRAGVVAALVVSMLIIGYWHGPEWKYLAWGGLHGLLMAGSALTLARRDAFWKGAGVPFPLVTGARVLATFALVSLAEVIFRAPDFSAAGQMYGALASPRLLPEIVQYLHAQVSSAPDLDWKAFQPRVTLLVIALMIAGDLCVRAGKPLEKLPLPLQLFVYNAGLALVVCQWILSAHEPAFEYYHF